jgi:DNA-binding NarL/FixJ family response regulator
LLILVLSMHDEELFAVRALQAGANGYLMKQEGTQNILEAVRELQAGNCYLSRGMHGRVAKGLFAPEKSRKSPVATLSDKEFAILQMIGMGMGTREISERLSRSVKTIEAHRANIKEKLGLKTGPELLRYAMQMVDAG